MQILIAEDDPRLGPLLVEALTEAGWEAELVADGRAAFGRALPGGLAYDVLLLDWMLPGMDGVTVCRRLRELGVTTPVLLLTARGAVADRIDGLDGGADDYLAKPFDLGELLARLRALHRRSTIAEPEVIRVGDLVLDVEGRSVSRGDTPIELSVREFDILRVLLANAGKVVSRYDLFDRVWDGETDIASNVMDVHLARIRAKIDKPFGTDTITTVRGAGFRAELPS
ncbi:response regulator transcription factor [Nocardioides jejuensis]|uniref:Response regulator transcription factor n=1 Tax=Nocardioides jejuensis TaxID=2502782 RepID=A0A4R1CLT5_9ACTN|nr:response regulator transcription factor [Nocardioides jejuensis]TCJ31008.1 response regulator transcription factor [Nocardioides jejuensis]